MPHAWRESDSSTFVKRNLEAPEGFFACEAAGLRWLAEAPSGVECVSVLDVTDHAIVLTRLEEQQATQQAAQEFGRRLSYTHRAGAEGFGAPPPSWRDNGWFGPLDSPIPVPLRWEPETLSQPTWGEHYAHDRLVPMKQRAGRAFTEDQHVLLDQLIRRCEKGDFEDGEAPSRIHGDLWSGNVMWTPQGAVVIDPAAHGGHRETDLAYLALFGIAFYEDIIQSYHHHFPLRSGWQERQSLHQVFMLLAHVVLFGRSYVSPTLSAVTRALALP